MPSAIWETELLVDICVETYRSASELRMVALECQAAAETLGAWTGCRGWVGGGTVQWVAMEEMPQSMDYPEKVVSYDEEYEEDEIIEELPREDEEDDTEEGAKHEDEEGMAGAPDALMDKAMGNPGLSDEAGALGARGLLLVRQGFWCPNKSALVLPSCPRLQVSTLRPTKHSRLEARWLRNVDTVRC